MSETGKLDTQSSGLKMIKGDGGWKGMIVFAIIWNLFVWPFAFIFFINANLTWFVYIFVSIFPLVGLAFIFFILKTYLPNRRLGKPLLALLHSGIPGAEPFQAKIHFYPPLAQRIDSAEIMYMVKVSLVCVREDRRSEDAKITTIWEQVALQANYPRGTKELTFRVELPESLPAEATSKNKLVREHWQVVLETLGATVKYEVPVNTTNMNRIEALSVNQPDSFGVPDSGKTQTKPRAPKFVQWIAILMVAFMLWDFAGDLITPFMHTLVLKIFNQQPENVSAQAKRVHKPGKLVPIQLDSLAGNGFGVVARVTGQMEIGEDEVAVYPESIELRSIYQCDPDCPFIRSVHFALTKDAGEHFSVLAQGLDIPVNARLPDSGSQFVKLSEAHKKIFLEVKQPIDLTETRLTLGIEGDVKSQGKIGQASWYTHTDIFSIVLGAAPPPLQIGTSDEERLKQARKAVYEDRVKDLKQLLETGVEVNARNEQGVTMLMSASERKNLQAVKILLRHGADVQLAMPLDKEGNGGNTALHLAVREDAVEVVDALLSAGANAEAVANQVWTPVHYAAYRGAVKTMRHFHARNINIDEPFKGARRSTPLMLAAQYEQVEMIRNLLEMGADPERKDIYGENACGYAKFFKKPGAISALECN